VIEIPLHSHYAGLGEGFCVPTQPTPVAAPTLIRFNQELAQQLGLEFPRPDAAMLADVFSGNRVPSGAEPIAMAYSGHQFGHFNPYLGDGRALLLGELTTADGRVQEIHLKGSGPTRFSRNGDGRAALGPVLREYLVSEAMAKLGVPTTRALAAVATGEEVFRDRPLPGGVITRVASSFVRVGTFQHFSMRGDEQSVRTLADFVIARLYPEARETQQPYRALLQAVVDRQARLIAQWMHLGFIHGVMNTDNMSVAGETIDYGPCAFMDDYEHQKVFSSIDHGGRYAYNQQPGIGLWNLTRLAESLVPLLAEDGKEAVRIAQDILKTYIDSYEQAWLSGMRAKCGLTEDADAKVCAEDKALIEELMNIMADNRADFTLTFHYLSRAGAQEGEGDAPLRALFDEPQDMDHWLARWRWRWRLAQEDRSDEERQAAMQAINPVYIPRNHQIEAAIRAAEDRGDLTVFHALHEVLQHPFSERPGKEEYMQPPQPEETVTTTFCGT
jgi:uncharacterized protein YdiU (UPF0061 family)